MRTAPITRIVAHQGFHAGPEPTVRNSMEAFRRASTLGIDAFETDIHRTKDGVLILNHDPHVSKGGPLIADLTYDQLPLLEDGQKYGKVAELAALAQATGHKVDFEIKEPGYERQIVEELSAALPLDQWEIISFVPDAIRAVEAVNPAVRTGFLGPELKPEVRDSWFYPVMRFFQDLFHVHPTLDRAREIGADFVSTNWREATTPFIHDAIKRGIPLDVWTVDDAATMQRLLRDGVTGIVTNQAPMAKAIRDAHISPPAK